MSEFFQGVTFANQNVTPVDDAILRRRLLSDGILTGCELTYAGYTLTMAAGYLIACGRQIRRPTAENWAISDATSGYARVLMTVDLTRTSTEDVFDQVNTAIQYATSADGFPALIQDDINATGSEYQLVLAVVSLGTGGITGIVRKLNPSKNYGSKYNLLDNSDFTNPVNQRGLTSVTPGTNKTCFIDRWCAARTKVSVTADGVMVAWDGKNGTAGYIQQKLSGNWNAGDTYTVAAKIDGSVVCGSFALPTDSAQVTVQQYSGVAITVSYLNDVLYYSINTSRAAGILVEWAALYEGEYTAETLPPYVPKGYASELMECQRYYYNINNASNVAFPGMLFDANTVRMSIRLPVIMRVAPSVVVSDISKLDTYTTGGAVIPTGYRAVTAGNNKFIVLNLTVPSGKTVGTPTVTRVNTIIEISADL